MKKRSTRGALGFLVVMAMMLVACGDGNGDADVQDTEPDSGVEDEEDAEADPDPGADDEEVATDDDAVQTFYEGETITIITPTNPGGGSDTFARLVAPFMEEHIPGNPTIQVENRPGGGLIIGSNEWWNSDRDGMTLLMMSTTNLGAWLLDAEGVEYDLTEMQPIIGGASGFISFVSADTGVETPEDLLNPDTELVYPGTSATGAGTLALLQFETLGIREDINIVFGYEGAGDQRLAFEQGEANFPTQSGAAFTQNVLPFVESGEANALMALGIPDGQGGVTPDPAFPELPSVGDAYEQMYGERPSGIEYEALLLAKAVMPFRGLFGHQDFPPEALEALAIGATATFADPDFLDAAGDDLGDYPLFVGDDWDPIVETIRTADPETRQWLIDWLAEEYEVS